MRIYSVIISILCFSLISCASINNSHINKIEVSHDLYLALPLPKSLGYNLSANQLIEANWKVNGEMKTERLPVQLEVSGNMLSLAGFSPWGTRVLSLTYQNGNISTEVLSGLNNNLPKPQQVLFNLIITLWPSSAWEDALNDVRWQLFDNGATRYVIDENGRKIIQIEYSEQKRGDVSEIITFTHLTEHYKIKINTLQYQKNPQ